MLHQQYCVSQVAKTLQRIQQPPVVTRMQTDGWFIKNIQHTRERSAHLPSQTNPLRLPARQCRHRTIERQIAETHVVEKLQPMNGLVKQITGNLFLRLSESQLPEELQRFRQRHAS